MNGLLQRYSIIHSENLWRNCRQRWPEDVIRLGPIQKLGDAVYLIVMARIRKTQNFLQQGA